MNRYLNLICLLLLTSQLILAQSGTACVSACEGNLGENIFPDGDFGSGTANILPNDPGIAPGYTYQINPPPNDGYYVITNNTTPWGSFAIDNWIKIEDNGPGVNGYMMVVNCAYEPGIFYTQQVAVCANTLYEMSVDVVSLIGPAAAAQSIKSNVAFLIDGVDVCSTGDIPHDGKWHTHRFSFTSGPTTDVVVLAFRNNAPGGYGNDMGIDNISFRACGPTLMLNDTSWFCKGEPLNISLGIANSPYNTPNFQWQTSQDGSNWTNINGGTSPDLSVNNPQEGDVFRLLVANSPDNLGLSYCRSLSYPTIAALDDLVGFAIGGTDTLVCNGAPGILQTGVYADYTWTTGATNAQIAAATPGWYGVSVTSVHGCPADDSILVYEVELLVESETQDPVCYGDSTGQISIFGRQGGTGQQLTYTLDAGMPGIQPMLEGIGAGTHLLAVKDSLGCTVKIPFTLQNPPQLTVDIGPDRKIMAYDTIAFHAMPSKSTVRYDWQPADTLNCADCADPIASPLRDIWFSVLIQDELGCEAVDSVWVDVSPRLDVYAPNAFKPMGEGENTYFSLFPSKSAVMIKRFAVFDRWGGLVFLRENLPPGDDALRWYGEKENGRLFDQAVYVWYAEILFTDGIESVFKGNVTLIR